MITQYSDAQANSVFVGGVSVYRECTIVLRM